MWILKIYSQSFQSVPARHDTDLFPSLQSVCRQNVSRVGAARQRQIGLGEFMGISTSSTKPFIFCHVWHVKQGRTRACACKTQSGGGVKVKCERERDDIIEKMLSWIEGMRG